MSREQIHKYPRTRHLQGSRLQPGDEDLLSVPLSDYRGQQLVIEEKLDGANSAVSFGSGGELLLQSRGHYLVGGHRERHFAMFKSWAQARREALHQVLGQRYVMYGEWVFAKHTIFYDALPHYFFEFDVLDREAGVFLSTAARQELLAGLPVVSVPVLLEGPVDRVEQLHGLVQPSLYKSADWRDALRAAATAAGAEVERVIAETDASDRAEGLYLKVERDGVVVDRLKFVRQSFLTTVLDAGNHWLDRGIVPNGLAPGVDLFAGPGSRP